MLDEVLKKAPRQKFGFIIDVTLKNKASGNACKPYIQAYPMHAINMCFRKKIELSKAKNLVNTIFCHTLSLLCLRKNTKKR